MDTVHNVKVVLLGNSGVGKTKILERYMTHSFTEDQLPTQAASSNNKQLDFPAERISIKLTIWDTAGQEEYRSIASNYYQQSQAAVLVYDITSQESFKGVAYWAEQLKERVADDIILAVVGNKSDLVIQEKVSVEEARDYADSLHAFHTLTSAKDGTNIDNLFDELCARLIPQLRSPIGANPSPHVLPSYRY